MVQIGESLRPFVSRLELYQPYLVRLDETMDSIRQMIHDPQSDLGEFVRIQMASPDCPGSLLELLQKPGDRLLKYPVYFKVCAYTTRFTTSAYILFYSNCLSLLHETMKTI